MPFGRTTKIVMVVAMFAFITAVVLFGVYASIFTFGNLLIDPLVYIGAFVLAFSVFTAAFGAELWFVGHIILWGTHVACRMDRRRAQHIFAKKSAEQYVR